MAGETIAPLAQHLMALSMFNAVLVKHLGMEGRLNVADLNESVRALREVMKDEEMTAAVHWFDLYFALVDDDNH